jgi:hypothetical protein
VAYRNQFTAYFVGDTRRVESVGAETVTVYSLTGVQLYSAVKNEGMIEIPLPLSKGTVRGGKSGILKVINTN